MNVPLTDAEKAELVQQWKPTVIVFHFSFTARAPLHTTIVQHHGTELQCLHARTDVRMSHAQVDFLLATQSTDGWWGPGVSGAADVMRSPRSVSLLSWWLHAVETGGYRDKHVELAVARYMDWLRIEGIGPAYGLCVNTITTGMAGIAIADAILLGVTY